MLGTLIETTPDRIAIPREDERAGTVPVHFPRLGSSLVATD